jgi:nitroreductase
VLSKTAASPVDLSAEARQSLLALLEMRRSVAITGLGEPGPDAEDLRRILTVAARVPDHGILEPWRFIVLAGQERHAASRQLAQLYFDENEKMAAAQREKFAGIMSRVFTHAPVVVIVVSRIDPAARIPFKEQDLSAGAVCMNMLTAVHALGFNGIWLTGWPAYSPGAGKLLGLAEGETVAGIIHIGTAKEPPVDRKRPDMDAIVTYWQSTPAE